MRPTALRPRRSLTIAAIVVASLTSSGCDRAPADPTQATSANTSSAEPASGEGRSQAPLAIADGSTAADPSGTESAANHDDAGAQPQQSAKSWSPRPNDIVETHIRLEDPSGHALDHFYAALARTDDKQPGAITRVLHLGDSSIGIDGLPHAIRKRMQQRFGDAGPGFVLPQRWTSNYDLKTVSWTLAGAWSYCYIAYLCRDDGHYGLGGVIFSSNAKTHTTVRVRPSVAAATESAVEAPPTDAPSKPAEAAGNKGPVATAAAEAGAATIGFDRVEIWYRAMPHSGRLNVRVSGDKDAQAGAASAANGGDATAGVTTLDGNAEVPEDRFVELPKGSGTQVDLRPSGGPFRMYGLVLENNGPGVVWDSASMIGAFTKRLGAWDDEHIKKQLEHRRPDLIVLNYGGNDLRRVVASKLSKDAYKEEYRAVLKKVRAGAPQASCLIDAVIDHGASGQYTVTPKEMAVIVEAQRELAAEEGCAFFDTYTAMGGGGAIHVWRKEVPSHAEPDLKHLNHRGRDRMGRWIYEAIVTGYVEFRKRSAAG